MPHVGPILPKQLLRLSILALLLAQQSVFALLNIDGTRNQVFVFGSLGIAYDSNIFAQNGGASDVIETLTAGTEINRRAGLISVGTTLSVAFARYNRHSDLNAINPSLTMEFTKTGGRLTGSLLLNAFRTEQADSAVNLRTTSWNIPVTLNLRYPLNEKFYATSQSIWQERRFDNTSNGLSNYSDVSEGLDGFYVYTSKLDLLAGYRVRFARTDAGRTTDQDFSVGATGALLPKVNGMVRFGVQNRRIDSTGESFNQVSALGQASWTATRKLTVVAVLSRDFNTTATAVSVDTLSTSLSGEYAMSRRIQFDTGFSFGRNRFLDQGQAARTDDFFSWNASATYSLNDHFKVASSLSFFHNQSDVDVAEFDRRQFSVTVSSRY
jgi:hypothetical protein